MPWAPSLRNDLGSKKEKIKDRDTVYQKTMVYLA